MEGDSMPVELSWVPTKISKDEFHKIAYTARGHCHDIHNALGNLLDEQVYRDELTHACLKTYPTRQEAQLRVSHCGFSKDFYLDLLVENGIIFETKAVAALTGAHTCQLLNYLLLTGLSDGMLINFGSRSVECEFVSTRLTPHMRTRYDIDLSSFIPKTAHCHELQIALRALLDDLGVYLELRLYRDALLHVIGGMERFLGHVQIHRNGRIAGFQKALLLSETVALKLSSVSKTRKSYEAHLRKYIPSSNLEAVQWLNFDQDFIELKTIQ
jgi:GxxExxY protein